MAKIRGDFMYAEESDRIFSKGQSYEGTKVIDRFCKKELDTRFDNWLVIGRDFNTRNFKEVDGGDLLSGVIMTNLKPVADGTAKGEKKSLAQLAMMILDVVEAVCDDERQTEHFLEALCETAKYHHEGGDEEVGLKISGERAKIKILKELLDTCVDFLPDYKSKEKYLRSCISSVIPARILASDDERLKNKLRKSMKAGIAGDKKGGAFAGSSMTGVDNWLKSLLNAIDEGKSADEIGEMLEDFAKNIKG